MSASPTAPGEADVARIARTLIRRHAASPLTGTAPFWERVAREVVDAASRLQTFDVSTVAEAAAPAFAGSPVTSSPTLWQGIVRTALEGMEGPGATACREGAGAH